MRTGDDDDVFRKWDEMGQVILGNGERVLFLCW